MYYLFVEALNDIFNVCESVQKYEKMSFNHQNKT